MIIFLKIAVIITFIIVGIIISCIVIKSVEDNKSTEIGWKTWKELRVYKSNKLIK